MLRCVVPTGRDGNLTHGTVYPLIVESAEYYAVIDNHGSRGDYFKHRFEEVSSEPVEDVKLFMRMGGYVNCGDSIQRQYTEEVQVPSGITVWMSPRVDKDGIVLTFEGTAKSLQDFIEFWQERLYNEF